MTTVLLIEDHAPTRTSTAETLALAGYAVLQAPDGRQGVEMARTARPDVIVCDIVLPELDGYGVLHILHQDPATTGIPFLFLTARAQREDVERGMSAGADDYLTKPCDDAVLLAAIAMRLEKHAAHLAETPDAEPPPATPPPGLPALYDWLGAHLKSYKKKHVLFLEGDPPHSLHWLRQGVAKTYKTDPLGNEYILELGRDGHFLGHDDLLAATDHSASAVLLHDSSVGAMPRHEFLALLARHPDVARHFAQLLAHGTAARGQRLLQLAYEPARQRLARALLAVEAALNPLHLPGGTALAREDLAALVGASRETVSRMLGEFGALGLVEVRGHRLVVVDAGRLGGVRH